MSRIKFNPATNEVEIEGSEKFISNMLAKIQEIMSGAPAEKVPSAELRPVGTVKKETKGEALPFKGVKRVVKKKAEPEAEKTTLFDKVVGLIQKGKGLTTSELMQKTGMTRKQIWGITYRAEKSGKIRKSKRGVYEAAG